MIKLIRNLKEMEEFSAGVIKKLRPRKEATILALSGNLGSGKTAFVKTLAKNLGVKRIIQSPTFVIMKNYKLQTSDYKLLIHIDAYRIEKNKELKILGWGDLIKDPKNLIAIEWPENVKKLIPKFALNIKFKFIDEKTRSVSM